MVGAGEGRGITTGGGRALLDGTVGGRGRVLRDGAVGQQGHTSAGGPAHMAIGAGRGSMAAQIEHDLLFILKPYQASTYGQGVLGKSVVKWLVGFPPLIYIIHS